MMITRRRSLVFLKDQIEKTRRYPARVPIIIAMHVSAIFRRAFVNPIIMITRRRSFIFIKDQIGKTCRRPTRIPTIIAVYGSAMFRRVYDESFRSLSLAKPRLKAGTLQTISIPPANILVPPEDDLDPLASFRSGIRAMNDVRIADAVRLLRRAATMECSKFGVEDLWIRREAYKNLGVALHHGLGRLDEAVCCWRESVRLSHSIALFCFVR